MAGTDLGVVPLPAVPLSSGTMAVSADESNALDRDVKFLRGGLRQLGARTLADLDLARQDGDRAIRADVNSVQPSWPARVALAEQVRHRHGKHHAGSEDLDELAPADLEVVEGAFVELALLRLGEFQWVKGRFHLASLFACAAC
jgi:hypothetical protein